MHCCIVDSIANPFLRLVHAVKASTMQHSSDLHQLVFQKIWSVLCSSSMLAEVKTVMHKAQGILGIAASQVYTLFTANACRQLEGTA